MNCTFNMLAFCVQNRKKNCCSIPSSSTVFYNHFFFIFSLFPSLLFLFFLLSSFLTCYYDFLSSPTTFLCRPSHHFTSLPFNKCTLGALHPVSCTSFFTGFSRLFPYSTLTVCVIKIACPGICYIFHMASIHSM